MNAFQPLQLFQPYLLAGERILWSGQPKQGLVLSGRDAFLIPFSLIWGGFAIFWNALAWLTPFHGRAGGDPDWFFKLWGLPFLIVGLYFIAGRFFHDAQLRKKLFYAVTDQRIMVLRDRGITSMDIKHLPQLGFSEHRDGTGTLAFEADDSIWGGKTGFGLWLPALSSATRFIRVQNPRKVYELIRSQASS